MSDTSTIDKVEEVTQVKEPSLYKVLLINDDKTTFDFVISVLMSIFHKSFEESLAVTQAIHSQGQGIAGAPYTKEIAEQKAEETMFYAKQNGFPLTAAFEPI